MQKSFSSKSVSICLQTQMDEAIEIVLLLYWANNGIWLSGLKSIIPSSKDIGQIICAKKINSKSVSIVIAVELGGEQRRNQEFRFRFRQCRYQNFWQEKTGKFVNLWIDFREDIFPVYFYSESESYSLKSIQRITNSLAFSCQKFRYRHCRNRNRNSWFLLCSPPNI